MATKPTNATGRRKTSSARVFISAAKDDQSQIIVNKKEYTSYFPLQTMQMLVRRPLEVTERLGNYSFTVNVQGGGLSGQVGAVVHGIARALQKVEPELHSALKKAGLLTRDPRAVERKKYGRHKARKSTQFSKR